MEQLSSKFQEFSSNELSDSATIVKLPYLHFAIFTKSTSSSQVFVKMSALSVHPSKLTDILIPVIERLVHIIEFL